MKRSWPIQIQRNVGAHDRAIRVALGVLLVNVDMLLQYIQSSLFVLAAIVAVACLTTAVTAWDPIYQFLGVSTDIDEFTELTDVESSSEKASSIKVS